MATSGENYWPPTGRTSWPLTLVDREDSSAGSLVTNGAEVLSKEGRAAGCGALAAPVDSSRKTLCVRCERAHHEGGSVSSPLEGVRTTRMETLEASL